MKIELNFPDDATADKVGAVLGYWAAVVRQGGTCVAEAMKRHKEEQAAAEKTPTEQAETVVNFAKEAKKREAKKATKAPAKAAKKPAGKFTQAKVRSTMIDYVNEAAKVMGEDRKEIFKGLCGEFGVSTLKDLPEDKYADMVLLVEERVGELESMKAGE